MKTNHSKVAPEWLHWQQHHSPVSHTQHAAYQGEYRNPNSLYTVDGYDADSDTLYEFQGCFWHGCPNCCTNRTEKHRRVKDRCPDDVCVGTRKLQFLSNKGYNVITIWECE